MLRTFLLTAVVVATGVGVYRWAAGGPAKTAPARSAPPPRAESDHRDPGGGEPAPAPHRKPDARPQSQTRSVAVKARGRLADPLVVEGARVGLVEFPEVAVGRGGKIVALGTEVPPGTPFDPARMTRVRLPFLAVETTEAEARKLGAPVYTVEGKEKPWRRWRGGDAVEPGRVGIAFEDKVFLNLKEGVHVREGQLLGVIDAQLAVAEMQIKIARLDMTLSEVRTAEKTKDETEVRYKVEHDLISRDGGSREELRAKLLMWHRSGYEESGKRAAHAVACREVLQVHTTLGLHELRAPVSGMVRRMFKQIGETARDQENLVRIENLERLQAEGFVEVQDARRLFEGMPVIVEPTHPEAPAAVLRGHREAVTAVAVSRGPVPLVLAAGEDRTVRVWEMKRAKDARGKEGWAADEAWVLAHSSVVRSLACAPPKAERNVCVAGSADGVGLLLDLDQLEKKPLQLQESHRGPILAAAVSADGKLCATGGDDRAICVWKTGTGELVQRVSNAHRGPVTSLAFTPAGDLVSAGRDNRMAVWSVKDGKVSPARDIEARAGQVDRLGVSPDGTQALFDQGSQLRVLDLEDWSIRGVLRNSSASAAFTTFALFSPDGKMVLTAAGENRIQLWTNPARTTRGRATELRQLVWNDGAATSAAFDPQGQFAVTGTRDRSVLVWALPPAEEVREPEANGAIRRIDPVLDSSSRQVRIVVDVTKRTDRLVPGDRTSLVIYPLPRTGALD